MTRGLPDAILRFLWKAEPLGWSIVERPSSMDRRIRAANAIPPFWNCHFMESSMANAVECPEGLRIGDIEDVPLRAKDFLKALRALGARVGAFEGHPHPTTLPRRQTYVAYLSCELKPWIDLFGEPQDVSSHYDLLTHLPFQAWQQPFVDGVVTCVGHLFERAPGRYWVTVARVLV